MTTRTPISTDVAIPTALLLLEDMAIPVTMGLLVKVVAKIAVHFEFNEEGVLDILAQRFKVE